MLHWTRRHPNPPATRRARLSLETLEARAVPATGGMHLPELAGALDTTVYVETNNPTMGQNAVLAFRHTGNGSLKQIGSFNTGGTGQLNLPKVVGPDDGDHEVVASRDGRFLFAVNQGSNSITSFRIRTDGSLNRVGTYSSGGVQPDSIGLAGGRLYVANRGDAAAGHTGTVAPNVTGFTIAHDGSLTPIASSTVTFPVDTFVTQALVSRNGRLLFAQVASVSGAAQGNTIAPFAIQSDGTLKAAPGGNVGASANPTVQLGVAFNPHLNIIYAGLAASGQVGVYTYDETGRTSFVDAVSDQGKAPCWIVVSADGRFLYVANTASDTVGVYSLADPLHPVEVQDFLLGGPSTGPDGTLQSNTYEIALDPSGRTLYVVNQSTSATAMFPQGNQLHTLAVARDGTLSEPHGPVVFATTDVPANAHPQGVAVVGGLARLGRNHDDGPDADAMRALNPVDAQEATTHHHRAG